MQVKINDAAWQLQLERDASSYARLTVDGSGDLTIAPSGGLVLPGAAVTGDGEISNSRDLVLRGWYDSDGSAGVTATRLDMRWRNVVTSGIDYRMALFNDGGTELFSVDQARVVTFGDRGVRHTQIDATGSTLNLLRNNGQGSVSMFTDGMGVSYRNPSTDPTDMLMEFREGQIIVREGGAGGTVVQVWDTGGNIGVGTSDIEAWSGLRAIEFPRSSLAFGYDTSVEYIGLHSNAYTTAGNTGWKYKVTEAASRVWLDRGNVRIDTASPGTADAQITWTTVLTIPNAGGAQITPGYTAPLDGAKGLFVGVNSSTLYATNDQTGEDTLALYNGAATGAGGFVGIRFSVSRTSGHSLGRLVYAKTGTEIGTFIFLSRHGGSLYRELMRLDSSGYVGIGQASPRSHLDIRGTAHATDPAILTLGVTNTVVGNRSSLGEIHFYNTDVGENSAAAKIVGTSGNGSGEGGELLFYTKSPGAAQVRALWLAGDGSAFVWGALTDGVSDARWKANVRDWHGALDVTRALRPVEFDFLPGAPVQGHGRSYIAQEVAEVAPWLVRERSDGFLTLDWNAVGVTALAAVGEEHRWNEAEHESLRQETAALLARVDLLERTLLA